MTAIMLKIIILYFKGGGGDLVQLILKVFNVRPPWE